MTADAPTVEKPEQDLQEQAALLELSRDSAERALLGFLEGRDSERNFELIAEDYHPRIIRFLVKQGIHENDLQDVAQDVLLEVFKNLHGFRGDSRFSSWIFSIAVRVSSRWRQRFKREREGGGSLRPERPERREGAIDPRQLTALLDREKQRTLRIAVHELPGQQRRCLTLRLYKHRSYEEIAGILQISIGTVKAHISQGKKSLEDRFGESLFGDRP